MGIRIEKAPPVAKLILDRPDKKNAITEAMWLKVPALLAELAPDGAVKVVVLEGAGGTFSAGADIAEFERVYATPESGARYGEAVRLANDALARFEKPVVAAIAGHCVGGGCGLALACDLRFAGDDARLGITPAKLGLVYPPADTARLVELVGPSRAKDLLFTGRLVGAAEALAMGLVDRVVPAGELGAAVAAYANDIAAVSQFSVRFAKRVVRAVLDDELRDSARVRALYAGAMGNADFAEGREAFLERRAPRFTWS